MKHARIFILCMTMVMGALLSACGSNAEKTNTNVNAPTVQASNTTNNKGTGSSEPATRMYTDSKGHQVEIPTKAVRVIYTGGELGDLLAIDVKPVGAALGIIGDQIAYPELIEGISDVGDLLGDLEKVTALDPDLILLDSGGSYYEENAFDQLSKIAPTITYDRLSTNERLRVFGDIFGKQAEAEQWISNYDAKAKDVVSKLNINTDVTASVFLQLGKDFYIMGNASLGSTVYETLGFSPSAKVKEELIDKGEAFANISSEVYADLAGEWMFVLTDDDETTRAAADSFTNEPLWKAIPAVKNGKVYYLNTMWNFDDAITKERLLDELPNIVNQ
ncbi:ABC transporter substrate-binding protein [Paenibacillus luteus]|uniref:ABC transporter substrate-binding protein n=1 Tax=Paenibacillus luteus TaxID=2545753 RepID=UPI0011450D6A|nr:ABC transporter substrate-binding protein [Paenibacillus luteus]